MFLIRNVNNMCVQRILLKIVRKVNSSTLITNAMLKVPTVQLKISYQSLFLSLLCKISNATLA